MKSNDFFFEVARGSRTGMTPLVLSGSNADIDAAEDMWVVGGDVPGLDTTGFSVEVVSDDADDAVLDTGANSVLIRGVDPEGNYQETVVLLNGATPVAASLTWGFINSAEVWTAGTSKANEGTILVRIPAGATKATIEPLFGVSNGAFYFVPSGYRFIVTEVSVWAVTAGTIVFGLQIETPTLDEDGLIDGYLAKVRPAGALTTAIPVNGLDVIQAVNARSLVKVRAMSVSAANQNAGATIRGVLMTDSAV